MARVEVHFDGDARGAKRAGDQAEASIRGVGRAARQQESHVAKLGASIRSSLGGAAVLGAKAATGGILGLGGAIAYTGIQYDDLRQKSQIAFTTMLGSGEKAKTMLDDLAKFAAATPFEFPELVQASQKLLAMGFAAKDLVPTMTAVGDAVAGLGGGSETLDQVTRALGQMQAKGKASSEEMLQLTEAGIPAWQMLADKIGVSVPKAMELVQKRAVDSATAIGALTEGMEKRFGGMMEKQSHTFSGLVSTLKDTFGMVSGKVMQPFFDMATKGMERLVGFTNSPAFTSGVEKFGGILSTKVGPILKRVGEVAIAAFRAAWPFVRKLGEIVADTFRAIGKVIAAHRPQLEAIWTRVAWVVNNVLVPALRFVFTKVLPGLIGGAIKLVDHLTRIIESIANTFRRVFEAIKQAAVRAALDVVEPFSHLPGKFGEWARKAKTALQDELDKMKANSASAGTSSGDNFGANFYGRVAAWARSAAAVEDAIMRAHTAGVGAGGILGLGIAARGAGNVNRSAAFAGDGSDVPHPAPAGGGGGGGSGSGGGGGSKPKVTDLPADLRVRLAMARTPAEKLEATRAQIALLQGRFAKAKGEDRADLAEALGGARDDLDQIRKEIKTAGDAEALAIFNRLVRRAKAAQAAQKAADKLEAQRRAAVKRMADLLGATSTATSAANARLRARFAAAGSARAGALSGVDDLEARIGRLPDELQPRVAASMAKIRRELATVTDAREVARITPQMRKIATMIEKALDTLKERVKRRRSEMSDALSRISSTALDVFDAQTKKLSDAASVSLFGTSLSGKDLTPAEQALKARQDARDADLAARSEKELRDELATVQRGGTTAEIAAAQRSLDDFLFDQETKSLEKTAAAQRSEADAALAAESKRIEDERGVIRRRFAARLDEIGKAFASEEITAGEAQKRIAEALKDPEYQTDFASVGETLGKAVAEGFTEALSGLQTALDNLTTAINTRRSAEGLSAIDGIGNVISPDAARAAALAASFPSFRAFALGGRVPGRYVGIADTVAARLTPGEEVIDRSLAADLRAYLARNTGGGDVYLDGARVGQVLEPRLTAAQGRRIGYASPAF